jgi:hypothetical protein
MLALCGRAQQCGFQNGPDTLCWCTLAISSARQLHGDFDFSPVLLTTGRASFALPSTYLALSGGSLTASGWPLYKCVVITFVIPKQGSVRTRPGGGDMSTLGHGLPGGSNADCALYRDGGLYTLACQTFL